ncbi:hypothetical protein D3C85_293080 [compost metagenome]
MIVGGEEWNKFVDEMEAEHPEEMEAARLWAKEYLDKVRSGELQFDIKSVYFDENGNLREEG